MRTTEMTAHQLSMTALASGEAAPPTNSNVARNVQGTRAFLLAYWRVLGPIRGSELLLNHVTVLGGKLIGYYSQQAQHPRHSASIALLFPTPPEYTFPVFLLSEPTIVLFCRFRSSESYKIF